jgi:alanine dehydrogenase
VAGVQRAQVVVIGGGVAGLHAATVAAGMQAEVTVLDTNLARLRQIDDLFQGRLQTLASTAHSIEEACLQADLVIGAVLVAGARAPKLVSDELVAAMRPGSVLVDISVDQGGCFESTRPTTHAAPTFRVAESVFYCVANMPGAVPHTSTWALTNATLPWVLAIAQKGWRQAVTEDVALALGVSTVGGVLVAEPVAEAHGLPWTPLADLLTA